MPFWRQIKFSFLTAIIFSISSEAFAKDVTVFDVRRPLAMENGQVLPKDYYINAGSDAGIKPGMIFAIVRRQSLYDAYQQKSPGELIVKVGELKIIHVQNEVSVARLEGIDSRDKLPTLEFDAIMVGDKVDMSSGKMAPQKTAQVDAILVPVNLAPAPVAAPVAPTPAAAPVPAAGATAAATLAPIPSTQSQPM